MVWLDSELVDSDSKFQNLWRTFATPQYHVTDMFAFINKLDDRKLG